METELANMLEGDWISDLSMAVQVSWMLGLTEVVMLKPERRACALLCENYEKVAAALVYSRPEADSANGFPH
jgi:hypothetical protein